MYKYIYIYVYTSNVFSHVCVLLRSFLSRTLSFSRYSFFCFPLLLLLFDLDVTVSREIGTSFWSTTRSARGTDVHTTTRVYASVYMYGILVSRDELCILSRSSCGTTWNPPLPFAVSPSVAAYLYLTLFRNREFLFFITPIFRPCLFHIEIYRAPSLSLFFMMISFSVRSN